MAKLVGEHWVCSELARRGWAPALTRDGLARTDILAVSMILPRRPRIEVQVKAATKTSPRQVSWPLGKTVGLQDVSGAEWFVLVVIPEVGDSPYAYVVPRDHVSAGTYLEHQEWLTDPAAAPGQRNAQMPQSRTHEETFARYRDRWDLLDHPTTEAGVMIADRLVALIPRLGLPAGHPWRDGLPAPESDCS
ncbi:hypothetical protein Rai3103_03045 [Raineyella fluvialis]|uniref:DUF4365 domain-containing protein n=2 Tax=Raineyella fluvialis TaxID=2662261 RepID=A0A5Q2FIP8_9ACTN|nr:hypothetical protein Rai3103_03045 [Raineyella fluvialis]